MCFTAGVPGPALTRTLPAGHGSVVLSWSGPPSGPGGSGDAEELVGYVTEWTSGHEELRWNIESRDQNTTLIGGESSLITLVQNGYELCIITMPHICTKFHSADLIKLMKCFSKIQLQ